MNWIQALIMGIFQGLTEYLPVSSSGHLALAAKMLNISDPEKIMSLTIAVHVATVFSTLVVLWKEIAWLFKGLFKFDSSYPRSPYGIKSLNEEQNYALNIIVSMIPVGIVGLCFKDTVEEFFSSLTVVGVCLLATATLLTFSYFARPRKKRIYIAERCLHNRYSTSCRCTPWFITLRLNHRYRTSSWRQQGEARTVLVPDGHSTDSRRSGPQHKGHDRNGCD